ncbi:MAG: sensor histidine kinase [Planctomycetota bacterium]
MPPTSSIPGQRETTGPSASRSAVERVAGTGREPAGALETPELPRNESDHSDHAQGQIQALRKQLREVQGELQRVEAELEQSSQAASLGALAGMLAHEINNVLTPIGSYAQLALLRPEDTALTQKALERAASGADRGGRVCESILSFAREFTPTTPAAPAASPAGPEDHAAQPTAGVNQARGAEASTHRETATAQTAGADATSTGHQRETIGPKASCKLAHAWAAACEITAGELTGPRQIIAPAPDGPEGPSVQIDPTALQQVLSNLLLNAQRSVVQRWGGAADAQGQIELNWQLGDNATALAGRSRCSTWNTGLEALQKDAQHGWILLEIADNGVGISDAQSQAILAGPLSGGGIGFGPARQEGAGHGIGLVVTDRLVRSRGGAIGLGNADDGGALFGILLPQA